jgi:hypothetical protein
LRAQEPVQLTHGEGRIREAQPIIIGNNLGRQGEAKEAKLPVGEEEEGLARNFFFFKLCSIFLGRLSIFVPSGLALPLPPPIYPIRDGGDLPSCPPAPGLLPSCPPALLPSCPPALLPFCSAALCPLPSTLYPLLSPLACLFLFLLLRFGLHTPNKGWEARALLTCLEDQEGSGTGSSSAFSVVG